MKKRLLSVVMMICFLCTCASTVSFAAVTSSSFSDVSATSHSWAINEIEEMTNLGIIRGYTDGTFRPDQAIRKIEALLLLSRIAGFTEASYQTFLDYANSYFAPVLDEYDLGTSYNRYKPEIAFLLYKGILSSDELEDYIGDGNADEELLRYEAAILLTKIMGAEEEVQASKVADLDFADTREIPSAARKYVEYVYDQGLMLGVTNTTFEPNTSVTRAQISVMLYRIMNKLNLNMAFGIVTQIDAEGGVLRYRDTDGTSQMLLVEDDVIVRQDGANTTLDKLQVGAELAVISHNKTVYELETLSSGAEETVTGVIVEVSVKKSYTKLEIELSGDGKEKREFFITTDPTVTFDGAATTFEKLKKDDFVRVELKASQVTAVRGESKETSVSGIVEEVTLTPTYALKVEVTEGGKTYSTVYTAEDSVTVKRNGSTASLRDVLAGDKVTLTLKYGEISGIVATSTKSTVNGTISGIEISSQSAVTIKSGDSTTTYPIAMDAVYTVENKTATIYELRVGASVSANLEGGTVTALSQSAASSTAQKTGVIESLNASYGFLMLSVTDPATMATTSEQVFVSKSGSSVSATIINSATGKEILFKNLNEGDTVSVVGSVHSGAFVATTIIVIP